MRDSHRGVCADAISPVVVEALESRQMLSASLLRGVLKINGTAAADTITVGIDPANSTKILVNDGATNSRFARTKVSSISIVSGDGADNITIGTGLKQQVSIKSGDGDDVIHGGSSREVVIAGAGADQVFGGKGSDQIFGGDGNDTIDGGISNDYLYGDAGDDVITGAAGNDVLAGDSEDTLVFTGVPPTNIIGNDQLNGGDGNDWLLGGTRLVDDNGSPLFTNNGQDTFTGGAGNDIIDKGGTNDTITDKQAGDFVPVDDQPRVVEGHPGDVHTHVILKILVRVGAKYKTALVQPFAGYFSLTDLSALHTHDTSGLIHYEAAPGSENFSLGEFFRVWGISMDSQHVGRFVPAQGKKVTMTVRRGATSVFANGKWISTGGTVLKSTKFGGFVPVGDSATGQGGSPPTHGDIIEIRVG